MARALAEKKVTVTVTVNGAPAAAAVVLPLASWLLLPRFRVPDRKTRLGTSCSDPWIPFQEIGLVQVLAETTKRYGETGLGKILGAVLLCYNTVT